MKRSTSLDPKSIKSVTLLLLLAVTSAALAGSCYLTTQTACPQYDGGCPLIDDTDVYDVLTSTNDTGYANYTVKNEDNCGYQCGTEYKGSGDTYQLTNSCGGE